jgi:hypothetical protein
VVQSPAVWRPLVERPVAQQKVVRSCVGNAVLGKFDLALLLVLKFPATARVKGDRNAHRDARVLQLLSNSQLPSQGHSSTRP